MTPPVLREVFFVLLPRPCPGVILEGCNPDGIQSRFLSLEPAPALNQVQGFRGHPGGV